MVPAGGCHSLRCIHVTLQLAIEMGARLQFRAHTRGSPDRLVSASRDSGPGLRCLPREAERRNGASYQWAPLVKAPACRVTGRRAIRRSTAAICYAITVLLRSDRRASPLRSRQHLRCPSSDRVQPPKAGPSSGPDGDRASWDEGANPACRRRHPRSATERLRKAPSVNGDGVHHV